MAYTKHAMALTIALKPDLAKKQLEAAFRKAGACVRSTATALGVHEGTLYRWIHKLGLDKTFANIRIKAVAEGWASEVLVQALGPERVKKMSVRKRGRAA